MSVSWTGLFGGAGDAGRVNVRILRRHGEPLLILPEESRLATQAMSLYPAQTPFARMARAVVRGALGLRLPLPLERAELAWSDENPLARFMAEQAASANRPPCAILAGNPRAMGRRFVILPFTPDGVPAAVLKAGLDPEARALIAAEANFLASAPAGTRGLPALRARLSQPDVEAWSMDFLPGDSPRHATPEQLGRILSNWIDTARTVGVDDLPAWRATFAERTLQPMLAPLGDLRFHPALYHGDFAPWNIKVHPVSGAWQVLDWERGALAGMPCWDWLHFVIQTRLLVRRASAAAVRAELEQLWSTPAFREYTYRAGVAGHERALTVAYLRYGIEVVRPAEGMEELKHLLHLLSTP